MNGTEEQLISIVKDMREEGKTWENIAKEVKRAGFRAPPSNKHPEGRTYEGWALNKLILSNYPEMRTISRHNRNRKNSHRGDTSEVDTYKIISAIMESQVLNKQEKLQIISKLTR
jgi:hypothetical protein